MSAAAVFVIQLVVRGRHFGVCLLGFVRGISAQIFILDRISVGSNYVCSKNFSGSKKFS